MDFRVHKTSTAAAGSTTTDATALPSAADSGGPGMAMKTTAADDTKGVRIHADDNVPGMVLFVLNGVANKILKVYPPSGGTINGGSADAALSSASGHGLLLICSASGTWYGS